MKPPHHVPQPCVQLDHCYNSGGCVENRNVRRTAKEPDWTIHPLADGSVQQVNIKYYRKAQTEQIFKEERGLYQDKVFCFIHMSIQEFLAAAFVFQTFINTGVNHLSKAQSTSCWPQMLRRHLRLTDLYQIAVDKALKNSNGHLDLFLRFLLGLSLQTNQHLLQGLLTQPVTRFS